MHTAGIAALAFVVAWTEETAARMPKKVRQEQLRRVRRRLRRWRARIERTHADSAALTPAAAGLVRACAEFDAMEARIAARF